MAFKQPRQLNTSAPHLLTPGRLQRQRACSLRRYCFPDEGSQPYHRYASPFWDIYVSDNDNIRNIDNMYGIISEDRHNMVSMNIEVKDSVVSNAGLDWNSNWASLSSSWNFDMDLEQNDNVDKPEKEILNKEFLDKHRELLVEYINSAIPGVSIPEIFSIVFEYSHDHLRTDIFDKDNWKKLLDVQQPIGQEVTTNEICPYHNLDLEADHTHLDRFPKCNGCAFGRNFFRFMMADTEWSLHMWDESLNLPERIDQFIKSIANNINIEKLPRGFIEECYQMFRYKYLILYGLPFTTPLRLLPF